jgi:hypothetical protein|uniref:Uncharacterized protein n=1 Tax=viral metagenome TaxID=1070528 RepID=A0A6C0CFL8_9ZZZZ
MVESLMQQIQSAMNGGKKYVRKPVRSASPVKRKPVRSAAKPVKPAKRRVFPKMRRSVGGFFEELNEMFANNAKEEEKEKNGGTSNPMKTPINMLYTDTNGATGMAGGRFRAYKKKVIVKKAMTGVKKAAKPKRRMTYGGYEDYEAEAQEEEAQEGGRRRVFKKAPKKVVKPKRRPASRGRMSYGGNEEVEAQEGGRPRRPRSASPARRHRVRSVNH